MEVILIKIQASDNDTASRKTEDRIIGAEALCDAVGICLRSVLRCV